MWLKRPKKTKLVGMNTDANTWARAALRTFWRRVFTRLANDAQADSLAFRKVLEALR